MISGLAGQAKQIVKNAVKRYKEARRRRSELKRIRKSINSCGIPIPPLTEEEKNEIAGYWNKYGLSFPLDWHRFYYGTTGIKDVRYIPEPVFQIDVKPYFNNRGAGLIWGDKSYTDLFVRGVPVVRSVVRNVSGHFLDEKFQLISFEQAAAAADRYDRLVVKPTLHTDTGKGVKLLEAPYDLKAIDLEYKKNYVLQIPLVQHEEMALLNASSINTIRINSVLLDDKAHVMSAFVKVGQAGEFADNAGHDRYFIGITAEGRFCDYAIDHDLRKYQEIPSGFRFAGKEVPSFRKACRTAEKAHECLPHFGFVFWDVAIDQEGEPVIVEANLRYPDTVIPQTSGAGALLGDYTEEILNKYLKEKHGQH